MEGSGVRGQYGVRSTEYCSCPRFSDHLILARWQGREKNAIRFGWYSDKGSERTKVQRTARRMAKGGDKRDYIVQRRFDRSRRKSAYAEETRSHQGFTAERPRRFALTWL